MLGSKHRLIVTIDNPNNDPAYVADVLLPDDLGENQAMALHHAMAKRFGWAGTYFTRGDVDSAFVQNGEQREPITDTEWAAVRESRYWRNVMSDYLTEVGWEIVSDAITDALKETQ